MRTLAIETATEACSVAVLEDGEVIAFDHRELGRGHAERLVPMIAALPDKGRADRILVSLGPGSFTGVRIGIATARALGFAWGVEVLGYPTLALIAAQTDELPDRSVTVCMNGGHGEWFIADFRGLEDDGTVHSLTPDAATDRGAEEVIAGNRATDFAAMLGDGRVGLDMLPDARSVRLLEERWFTADLAPIYGRAPDAKPQTPVNAL